MASLRSLRALFAVVCLYLSVAMVMADDLETVRERLVQFFLDNGDCTQMDPKFCASGGCQAACSPAQGYSASLDPKTFRWPDINYNDHTSSDWQLSHHLLRTVALYRSYLCSSCSDAYQKSERQGQANGALEAYITLNPTPPQWWWLDIGIPGYLGASVTLADVAGGLNSTTREAALRLMSADPGTGAGQNLIWEQQALIFLSSLQKDAKSMASSFQTIWAAVHVESGDGIQADQSFYQHGPLLQSGAYGSDYGMDLVTLRALAEGTAYAASAAAANAIDAYILDGEALFMRWNGYSGADSAMNWDVACKGREISRAPVGLIPVNTGPYAPALRAASSSPRKEELRQLADRMQGNGTHLIASRHFWRSDTAVHHREAFASSVHMCSTRTYASEYVNGENSQAWLMGAGVNFFYRNGTEYSGIFPVWDWRHLPGVTSRNNTTYSLGEVKNHLNTSFVGGVSDGNYTLAAMDYIECSSCGDAASASHPVQAKKAWFFLDSGVVAMGAGISCGTAGGIATTLNQALQRGSVMSKVGSASWAALADGNYTYVANATQLLHDSLLYAPGVPSSSAMDAGQQLTVDVGAQTGSWNLINTSGDKTPVSENVFAARVEHGSLPTAGTYIYSVLANATTTSAAQQLEAWVESIFVVAHSTDALALEVSPAGPYEHLLLAVVFDNNVHLTTQNMPEVTITKPGTYLVGQTRDSDGTVGFVLAASDPTQQMTGDLQLQLAGVSFSGGSGNVTCTSGPGAQTTSTTVMFKLPTGLFAGSTVQGSCS